MIDSLILKAYPPFDPVKDSFSAPGVIDLVRCIASKLEMSIDDIMKILKNIIHELIRL